MPLMATLLFIVFLNNVSTSLYSEEVEASETRLYCLSGGIEHHWLGTLALVEFFTAFELADSLLRDLKQTKMFHQYA